MAGRLSSELKQTQPFRSVQVEAYLNLLRTSDALTRGLTSLLRGCGLSLPQYNVLRILRGAGEQGRTCGEIAERMITRDPDVTRLLDRLEVQGLVQRERDRDDRRVVRATIAAAGLAVLAGLDEPIDALHVKQLGHLSEPELRQLIHLLERTRENLEA